MCHSFFSKLLEPYCHNISNGSRGPAMFNIFWLVSIMKEANLVKRLYDSYNIRATDPLNVIIHGNETSLWFFLEMVIGKFCLECLLIGYFLIADDFIQDMYFFVIFMFMSENITKQRSKPCHGLVTQCVRPFLVFTDSLILLNIFFILFNVTF